MQPFITHSGLVAPVDRVNVDTDQMVPKQFLKALTRQGFGRILFYDWRYLPGEKPNPEFVLNFPRYKGASVLLARANFGCGSSREHAPWAIGDYGFRVILVQERHPSRRAHRSANRRTLPAHGKRRRLLADRGFAQPNSERQSRAHLQIRNRPLAQGSPAERPRRHRHLAPPRRRHRHLRKRPRSHSHHVRNRGRKELLQRTLTP